MIRRFTKAGIRDWLKIFETRPANTAEAVARARRLRDLSHRILGCTATAEQHNILS